MCQQQFGQFRLIVILSSYESYPRVHMSVNTLTRPTSLTADSWQDSPPHRRHSSAMSSPNSTAAHDKWIHGTSSNHTITAQPTQSVTARQQLWPLSTTIPRSICSGWRLCWASSDQQSWNMEAAVKAMITQCVFVNEPDDDVGQGLTSCEESYYSLCMWIFHVAVGLIMLERHDNVSQWVM